MPKPYSLSLYNSALNATQRFQRSLTSSARGWKRSNRSMGGCWQGSFTLDGTPAQLQDAFETWLGYEVRERAAGFLSWAGMVYEMDLTAGGVKRRRSLDLMANRVKTTYATLDWGGDNFVFNPGFEDMTAGAPNDDFWGWYEANGTNGAVQQAGGAGFFHGGAYSVQLDGDSDAGPPTDPPLTYVRQNIQVTPGAKYELSFWTRGDAGVYDFDGMGWFGVRNPNAPQNWLIGPERTYTVSATWIERTKTFIGPSEGEVMVFFIAPTDQGRTAYFDDAAIYEELPCVYETPWTEPSPAGSQGRYGVKEEVIHLDDYPETTSIAYRDTYHAEHEWPWMRPVSASRAGDHTLEVSVCGYVFTMNWMYLMEGDGTEDDIDDWLAEIVGTTEGRSTKHGGASTTAGDCQFVHTNVLDANVLQVPKMSNVETRPWDVIQEIAALGDASGNPWRAWVGPQRGFNYRPISVTPRYFLRRDGIYDTMAGHMPSNPWLMQPAVFRDMTFRSDRAEVGSFLASTRDLYVDQVTMADGWEQPELTTVLFSEADLLLAQIERNRG